MFSHSRLSTLAARTLHALAHQPAWLALAALPALMSCNTALAQLPKGRAEVPPGPPIRFIVPFPPGGGNDVVGRIIAARLQAALGQELVVENRGENGGTAGTNLVAKSLPDGRTLLINNISLAVNATLFARLPYDTLRDLAPLSIIGRQPSVLLVSPQVPARNVTEMLAFARGKSGQFIFGSGGTGSSAHLATERLMLATKVRMTHVPYKGLAQATTDLVNGRVDMVIATASTSLPVLGGGKARGLAVTTAKRSALFPQLPTMAEAGVAGYEVSTWYALLVQGRTPERTVTRLNSELGKIAAAASVQELFAAQGLEPVHTSPAEARAYIRSEIDKWRPVVKASGIKPE